MDIITPITETIDSLKISKLNLQNVFNESPKDIRTNLMRLLGSIDESLSIAIAIKNIQLKKCSN